MQARLRESYEDEKCQGLWHGTESPIKRRLLKAIDPFSYRKVSAGKKKTRLTKITAQPKRGGVCACILTMNMPGNSGDRGQHAGLVSERANEVCWSSKMRSGGNQAVALALSLFYGTQPKFGGPDMGKGTSRGDLPSWL